MKTIDVAVKKPFQDRYTGQQRKAGEKMKVTYDRLAEIRRSGKDYVEVVKPAATAEKK